jgi:hypothetical protein
VSLEDTLDHFHELASATDVPLNADFEGGFADDPKGVAENVLRCIETGANPSEQGLAFKINGASIFCRGVVWTPPDAVALAASPAVVRERLQLLRDGGFNLIRLAGTTVYECENFHRLCDELGLMVWQDMMFAGLDYPIEDEQFRIGDLLLLKRPDGTSVETAIAGLELGCPNPRHEVCVLLRELTKDDVLGLLADGLDGQVQQPLGGVENRVMPLLLVFGLDGPLLDDHDGALSIRPVTDSGSLDGQPK